jgi:hypothetical protein
MTYFCFVETETSKVPHMEPMAVDNLMAARVMARQIARSHRRPVAAHIFHQDERVDTVLFDDD